MLINSLISKGEIVFILIKKQIKKYLIHFSQQMNLFLFSYGRPLTKENVEYLFLVKILNLFINWEIVREKNVCFPQNTSQISVCFVFENLKSLLPL